MTLTAAPTSDGTSAIAAPYYLVIDPDNASNREVVEVTAASGTTVSVMTRDKEGRHGGTTPTHVDGTTVRMSVVKEMFEDVHDRIDAGVTLGTGTSGKMYKMQIAQEIVYLRHLVQEKDNLLIYK